jgi:hypothetical protein
LYWAWRHAGLNRVVDRGDCRRCVETLTVKVCELECATFAAACAELELCELLGHQRCNRFRNDLDELVAVIK